MAPSKKRGRRLFKSQRKRRWASWSLQTVAKPLALKGMWRKSLSSSSSKQIERFWSSATYGRRRCR